MRVEDARWKGKAIPPGTASERLVLQPVMKWWRRPYVYFVGCGMYFTFILSIVPLNLKGIFL
jgi:hypothetical protein